MSEIALGARRSVPAKVISLGTDAVWIQWRGRLWELVPSSFETGPRLTKARLAIDAMADEERLTPEVARDYHRALRDVVALAPKHLKPAGVLRRVAWHLGLRANPYRAATDAEKGQLLGFLLAAQLRSRVAPHTAPERAT